MITATVRNLLLSFAPVSALIGQRAYVQVLDEHSSLPAIRLQLISEVEAIHMRGPEQLREARVQVDSVASTLASAEAVDAAVHGDGFTTGLRTFHGVFGGVRFSLVRPALVRTTYDAEELRQYKIMRDYLIWWKPA